MAQNKPGRPPLDSKGASPVVCLALRSSDYDRLDKLAKQRRTSMQDVIRRGLKHLLHDERGGTLG